MSTINDARMPSLKDKIDTQESEQAKAVEEAKAKKVEKKKVEKKKVVKEDK